MRGGHPQVKVTREHLGQERVVWTIETGVSGPTIGLTANIHGDECTGVAILSQIVQEASYFRRGTLRVFPSLNPDGLVEGVRQDPNSGQDLNRLFPNCLDERLVVDVRLRSVWRAVQDPSLDMLVDIHADSGSSTPYVIIDRQLVFQERVCRQSMELAEQLGIFTIWEYPLHDYRRFRLQQTLTGAILNRLEVPCVTLEIGPRRRVCPLAMRTALSALGRMFVHHQMLRTEDLHALGWDEVMVPKPMGVWRRGNGPITKAGGLIVPIAPPGEVLREGDAIARMVDAQGVNRETVCATETCIVIAFPDSGWSDRWSSICTLAVLE